MESSEVVAQHELIDLSSPGQQLRILLDGAGRYWVECPGRMVSRKDDLRLRLDDWKAEEFGIILADPELLPAGSPFELVPPVGGVLLRVTALRHGLLFSFLWDNPADADVPYCSAVAATWGQLKGMEDLLSAGFLKRLQRNEIAISRPVFGL